MATPKHGCLDCEISPCYCVSSLVGEGVATGMNFPNSNRLGQQGLESATILNPTALVFLDSACICVCLIWVLLYLVAFLDCNLDQPPRDLRVGDVG